MRLAGFDYADHGAYFLTICTQNRVPLFGSIAGDVVRANAAGSMIERWWAELPRKFAQVELDEFIVMPNHAHGLLFINGPDVCETMAGSASRASCGSAATTITSCVEMRR